MSNNNNKNKYQRKQQLYVKSSSKSSNKRKPKPRNNKTNKKTSRYNETYEFTTNNQDIYIPNKNKKNKRKIKNKKSKKSLVLKIIGIIFLILLLTTTVLAYEAYSFITALLSDDTSSNSSSTISNSSSETESVIDPTEGENVNVLLIGLDEVSYHTDTMIVANLNTADGSIDLMSIPRDTYTKLPTSTIQEVQNSQTNSIMPDDGEMKLTELVTYTQDLDLGLDLLTDYIADMLGIEIENYVAISLESFSYLIDEIGGVYFDVPQRMYYNDNAQDLHIDLQPGYQLLNGDQAEQLIRFRKGDESMGSYDYPRGDLQRVEVQQDFLAALINQVLSKDNIISNLVSIGKTYYKYVTTDIGILDIPKYADLALVADSNNINTYSLPVEYGPVNGRQYAVPLSDDIKTLSDEVFFDIKPEIDTSEDATTDENLSTPEDNTNDEDTTNSLSKDNSEYTVTILNGSGKSGFAAETSDILTADGFTVLDIGDYTEERQPYTRLFVNDTETATLFEDYFDSVEIENSPNQSEDLIIVLGTDETLKGKYQ